eukprot:gene15294-21378_t
MSRKVHSPASSHFTLHSLVSRANNPGSSAPSRSGSPVEARARDGNPVKGEARARDSNPVKGEARARNGNPVKGDVSFAGSPDKVEARARDSNPVKGEARARDGNPVKGEVSFAGSPDKVEARARDSNPVKGEARARDGNPVKGEVCFAGSPDKVEARARDGNPVKGEVCFAGSPDKVEARARDGNPVKGEVCFAGSPDKVEARARDGNPVKGEVCFAGSPDKVEVGLRKPGEDPKFIGTADEMWASENRVKIPNSYSTTAAAAEIESKKDKVKRLERKCAEIAAQAQRRLIMSGYGASQGSAHLQTQSSWSPATPQEKVGKQAAGSEAWGYSSVKAGPTVPTSSPSRGPKPQGSFQQRPTSASPGMANTNSQQRPTSASPGMANNNFQQRPTSASPGMANTSFSRGLKSQSSNASFRASRQVSPSREHSSASLASPRGRPVSASPMFRRSDSLMSASMTQSELEGQLRDTINMIQARLRAQGVRESQSELEGQLHDTIKMLEARLHAQGSQSELEGQLRDTINMLQARLHAQGVREVENNRRLQQHVGLQPLFDQMAERFAYSSAQEVVDKIEFMENDKLGSFDLLLRNINQKLAERLDKQAKIEALVVEMWESLQQEPKFINAARERDSKQLDLQQLSNRVWHQHFRHKSHIRGDVVQTFDQLSRLAAIMANKIKNVDDELEKTKENEKKLTAALKRVNVQRRALLSEVQLSEKVARSAIANKERPGSAMPRMQTSGRPLSASSALLSSQDASSSRAPEVGVASSSRASSRSISQRSSAQGATEVGMALASPAGVQGAASRIGNKAPRPQSAAFSYIRGSSRQDPGFSTRAPPPDGMLLMVNVDERVPKGFGPGEAQDKAVRPASSSAGLGALYHASKLVAEAGATSSLVDASLAVVTATNQDVGKVGQSRASALDSAFMARLRRSAALSGPSM